MQRTPGVAADGLGTSILTIKSPFRTGKQEATLTALKEVKDEHLALTKVNVETVLDMLRPYLKEDGGNVKLAGIVGRVVKLKLEGNCVTCPSSEITMKMGLETGLKRKIPEIRKVVQVFGDEKDLNSAGVEKLIPPASSDNFRRRSEIISAVQKFIPPACRY